MRKKLLILGATGNTGFEVLKKAVKDKKIDVSAVIHSTKKKKLISTYATKTFCLDYSNDDDLVTAFNKIDTFYLALPRDDYEIQNAEKILQIAKNSSATQIIYLSSLFSDEDQSAFAKTKRQIENAIKRSGLIYTILKPTFFMSRVFFLPLKKETNKISLFAPVGGNSKVSFIDIHDIATIASSAVNTLSMHDQSIYLTGGSIYSMHEIMALTSKHLNLKICYVNEDEKTFVTRLRRMGYSKILIQKQLETFSLWRNNQLSTIYNDFSSYMGHSQNSYEDYIKRELISIKRIIYDK